MLDHHIQNVLNGDRNAFRHIISECKDNAYSLAMSVLKEEFIAKEVVQISFIKAFTKLDTFKGTSAFTTWFYRIVINESFRMLKKEKKSGWMDDSETLVERLPDSDSNVFHDDRDHQRYYINEALSRLSARNSLVLRLFYLEEKSVQEITEITGWTVSNTKVILHRAREGMKALLTGIYDFDKEELY